MEKKEIINGLLKNGAKSVNGLKVKNVTVTVLENYTRLGLTLDKPVEGYVAKEDGTFEKGETNVIFVSAFAVASVLKDNDDCAFAANHLVEHPEAMNVILSRAQIDIIQEPVTAGQEYRNPLSNNADNATVFDHDTIINHLTGIKLSDFSIRKLDTLADKMLGF
jgi:hypothetical protein